MIILVLFMVLTGNLISRTDRNFDKMISYFLLEDIKMSKSEFKFYFDKYSDAQLKRSYSFLLNGSIEDANDAFFNYLQMKPRSVEALIGFAISDTRKVKAAINNFKKASRLDPGSSIAFLCIGNEYLKKKNYPESENYFKLATQKSDRIEYKIIWSFLHLKMGNPDKIIALLGNDFVENQTSFYINYLLASAYYLKNNLKSMVKHMDLLNGEGENKKRGDLLIAKYYIKKRDFKKAKSILFQIKYDGYNEEYDTALAITMMNLNSSKSLQYLYKVFNINMWNKDINKQLGIYFYKRDKKKMVQHFIYRSLLSGIPSYKLKEYFSGIKFDIPDYKIQKFFQLFDVEWIDNKIIAVFAKKNSGEKNTVYIIDSEKNKIVRILSLPKSENGKFYKAFKSIKGNIVFSLFDSGNNVMSVYALSNNKNSYKIGKIISIKLYMHENLIEPSLNVGFDNSGTIAYITDGGIRNVAFKSPFLVKWSLTNVNPVYPKYPFDIIKYNFDTKEAFKILNSNQMKLVPIEAVKKYFLVNQAYIGNSKIKELILKGQKMDITSPDKVNTFFEDNLKSFLIYIHGAEDSFKGMLFKDDNSFKKLSESMFLGEKILRETTDIKLFRLDSNKKCIFVMRKDTNQLLNFNYDSYLYSYLIKNVKLLHYLKIEDVFYAIIDKGGLGGIKTTSTTMFAIDPYTKLKEYNRDDIQTIFESDETGDIIFISRNGEQLKINSSGEFEYAGPSFKETIYSISNDKDKEAVFINGRLIIIEKIRKKVEIKKNK